MPCLSLIGEGRQANTLSGGAPAAAAELDAEATADCAGGSGSGAAAAAAAAASEGGGMRIYLSQVKEWMVEFACDMVFIVVRTDCAWYKIRSVHDSYAGWFAPILKVARLAVKLLGVIQEEARSSRLSFDDLTKLLAAQPASLPTYISPKQPEVCALVACAMKGAVNAARPSRELGEVPHEGLPLEAESWPSPHSCAMTTCLCRSAQAAFYCRRAGGALVGVL